LGCQEIILPCLTPRNLLKKTGRDTLGELFVLKDRHSKEWVLSPTHEEAVVSMIASSGLTYKNLPVLLYQMTSKFRDEMKPRFGLMRAKEFLMKDLYCFSSTAEGSLEIYDQINACYSRIFDKLSVPFCTVVGHVGDIGGIKSQEFHIVSTVGEDKVVVCEDCNHGYNSISPIESTPSTTCPVCNSAKNTVHPAIEVRVILRAVSTTSLFLPHKGMYHTRVAFS